ncbi:hypothetical protein, partial [Escherichia coli]|uniref:hypothetical protein n=1 Tax=Escherichia coli TaxID=562 RepID=UPI001952F7A6
DQAVTSGTRLAKTRCKLTGMRSRQSLGRRRMAAAGHRGTMAPIDFAQAPDHQISGNEDFILPT